MSNKLIGYDNDLWRVEYEFGYTGNDQPFTLDAGTYLFICEGAHGGTGIRGIKEYGAITYGEITLDKKTTFHAVVGSDGGDCNADYTLCTGGFNGGAHGGMSYSDSYLHGPGGGGATDIRLLPYDPNEYPTYDEDGTMIEPQALVDELQDYAWTNEVQSRPDYTPASNETPILIFCDSRNSSNNQMSRATVQPGYPWEYQPARLYSFKIYESNVLSANMLPCYRISDNSKGVYDTIRQSFHPIAYNQNNVTLGNDVANNTDMPNIYQQVEYLDNRMYDTNNGQMINTNYFHTKYTKIICDCMLYANPWDEFAAIFGAGAEYDNDVSCFIVYTKYNYKNVIQYKRTLSDGTSVLTTHAVESNRRMIIEADEVCKVTYVDTQETFIVTNSDYVDIYDITAHEYTPLEYIYAIGGTRTNSSDGDSGYINTGYIPTANTKIEMDCCVIENAIQQYEILFGARNRSYTNNAFVFFSRFNNNNIPTYNRSGVETRGSNFLYNERITLICYKEKSEWYLHGSDTPYGSLVTTGTVDNCINPLFINTSNCATTASVESEKSFARFKLYGFKIYECIKNDAGVDEPVSCVDLLNSLTWKNEAYSSVGATSRISRNNNISSNKFSPLHKTMIPHITSSKEYPLQFQVIMFKADGSWLTGTDADFVSCHDGDTITLPDTCDMIEISIIYEPQNTYAISINDMTKIELEYPNLKYERIDQLPQMIRNFVPARRKSDHTVGLFDTVNRKFITQTVGGAWLAGPPKTNHPSLNSRIMVAAGAGGGNNQNESGDWYDSYSYGGGPYGSMVPAYSTGPDGFGNLWPTQTNGYAFGYGCVPSKRTTTNNYSAEGCGGGGGGWYSGYASIPHAQSTTNLTKQGGGGSSYIFTSKSYRPDDYTPDTKYQFNKISMHGGQAMGDLFSDNATDWNHGRVYICKQNTSTRLRTGDVIVFPCVGESVNAYLPAGEYKLRAWGGSGGSRGRASHCAKGGYSEGIIHTEDNHPIYVYTGGSGFPQANSGYSEAFANLVANANLSSLGFNGGQHIQNLTSIVCMSGGGTDIRFNQDNLYHRVIVAGGAGSEGAINSLGGAGGGTEGGAGMLRCGYQHGPGTQTGPIYTDSYAGGFGYGGKGFCQSGGYGGCGGGGWYGGSGVSPDGSADDDSAGSGGSGYVLTDTSYKPTGYGCADPEYYLTDTTTVQGGNVLALHHTKTQIEVRNIASKCICHDAEGYKYLEKTVTNIGVNYFDKDNCEYEYDKLIERNATGSITSYSGFGFTKTFISVEPSVDYVTSGNLVDANSNYRTHFYDEQENYLGWTDGVYQTQFPAYFTTPSNCTKIRFQFKTSEFDPNTVVIRKTTDPAPGKVIAYRWKLLQDQTITPETILDFGSDILTDEGLLDEYSVYTYDDMESIHAIGLNVIPNAQTITVKLHEDLPISKFVVDDVYQGSSFKIQCNTKRIKQENATYKSAIEMHIDHITNDENVYKAYLLQIYGSFGKSANTYLKLDKHGNRIFKHQYFDLDTGRFVTEERTMALKNPEDFRKDDGTIRTAQWLMPVGTGYEIPYFYNMDIIDDDVVDLWNGVIAEHDRTIYFAYACKVQNINSETGATSTSFQFIINSMNMVENTVHQECRIPWRTVYSINDRMFIGKMLVDDHYFYLQMRENRDATTVYQQSIVRINRSDFSVSFTTTSGEAIHGYGHMEWYDATTILCEGSHSFMKYDTLMNKWTKVIHNINGISATNTQDWVMGNEQIVLVGVNDNSKNVAIVNRNTLQLIKIIQLSNAETWPRVCYDGDHTFYITTRHYIYEYDEKTSEITKTINLTIIAYPNTITYCNGAVIITQYNNERNLIIYRTDADTISGETMYTTIYLPWSVGDSTTCDSLYLPLAVQGRYFYLKNSALVLDYTKYAKFKFGKHQKHCTILLNQTNDEMLTYDDRFVTVTPSYVQVHSGTITYPFGTYDGNHITKTDKISKDDYRYLNGSSFLITNTEEGDQNG